MDTPLFLIFLHPLRSPFTFSLSQSWSTGLQIGPRVDCRKGGEEVENPSLTPSGSGSQRPSIVQINVRIRHLVSEVSTHSRIKGADDLVRLRDLPFRVRDCKDGSNLLPNERSEVRVTVKNFVVINCNPHQDYSKRQQYQSLVWSLYRPHPVSLKYPTLTIKFSFIIFFGSLDVSGYSRNRVVESLPYFDYNTVLSTVGSSDVFFLLYILLLCWST